jgi:DNA-binding LacI/PurR family transcriptional regulator
MSVTAKEIAKRLGLSQPTVSRVLNNKHGIHHSPETRRRVLDMAAEMNYRPNAIARALQLGRTETISVVSTFTGSLIEGNLYFAELLDGILSAARTRDYNVLVRSTLRAEKLKNAIMGDGQSDGCLWVGPYRDDPLLGELSKANAPVVLVAARAQDAAACILADNYQAMDMVVTHLADLGHRRIVLVNATVPAGLFEFQERMAAFEAACHKHGVAGSIAHHCDIRRIVTGDRATIPTAAIGWNDNIAITAMQEIQATGFQIPEDISVVGFDSTHFCDTVTPALTSVHQPISRIGEYAVETLIAAIERTGGKTDAPEPRPLKLFPCRLDVRGTTGPARTSPQPSP